MKHLMSRAIHADMINSMKGKFSEVMQYSGGDRRLAFKCAMIFGRGYYESFKNKH